MGAVTSFMPEQSAQGRSTGRASGGRVTNRGGAERAAQLRQVPLFSDLSESMLERLAEHLLPRRLVRNQPIFLQGDIGDEMFLLLEGQVRIACESRSGREVTLAMLSAGSFFGEMALLDREPRSASAVSESQGRVLVLRREAFQRFLEEAPGAALSLLAFLSRRLRQANNKIQDLALLTVGQRLAALLCELAQEKVHPAAEQGLASAGGRSPSVDLVAEASAGSGPPPGPEPVLLGSSVNHRALAGLLGTSRETVSRLLADLKARGLVLQQGRRLLVCDLPGLQALVADTAVR